MYVKLNHFAVHLKLTRHCKSTVLQFFKKENRPLGRETKLILPFKADMSVIKLLTVFCCLLQC